MREFTNPLKRIVIKVGSSSITHENGLINLQKIDELVWRITQLKDEGLDVILVSSGSIVAGAKRLGLSERPKDTIGKQATSAVGQVALMQTYNRALTEYGYKGAQVLLTRQIELDPKMHKNTINTFEKLLSLDVVPIVNENDTISTFEIKFGDNDTLSAVVSRMTNSDLLIMLSDIEGLYKEDPRENPNAEFIYEVREIDDYIRSLATDSKSKVGTGGMITKINAAELCLERNIDVVITSSEDLSVINRIVKGEEIGTFFKRDSK